MIISGGSAMNCIFSPSVKPTRSSTKAGADCRFSWLQGQQNSALRRTVHAGLLCPGHQTEHLASSLILRAFKDKDPSKGLFGYLGRRSLGDDFFSYRGELKAARKQLFANRPEAMMQAFLLAKQNNLALSADVKGQIRDNLTLVNDGFRRNREISEMFLEIMRGPTGVAQSLRDMHHLAFLNRYIPEFKRIYCKVQHDAYHVYTVDIHSIFAVAEIEKLWSGGYRESRPLLSQVAADIGKPELVVLAVLFPRHRQR